MSKIIVSILSDQLLPNFLFIKDNYVDGDTLYFVTTSKTSNYGKKHEEIRGKSKYDLICETLKIKGKELYLENEEIEDLGKMQEKFKTNFNDPNTEYLVNLTGGTKFIVLALYNYFEQNKYIKAEYKYVPWPKNITLNLKNKELSHIKHHINIDEYLQLCGIKLNKTDNPVFPDNPEYSEVFLKSFKEYYNNNYPNSPECTAIDALYRRNLRNLFNDAIANPELEWKTILELKYICENSKESLKSEQAKDNYVNQEWERISKFKDIFDPDKTDPEKEFRKLLCWDKSYEGKYEWQNVTQYIKTGIEQKKLAEFNKYFYIIQDILKWEDEIDTRQDNTKPDVENILKLQQYFKKSGQNNDIDLKELFKTFLKLKEILKWKRFNVACEYFLNKYFLVKKDKFITLSNNKRNKYAEYIRGKWFEEYVRIILKREFGDDISVTSGIIPLNEGYAENEIDCIFTLNNTCFMIECKVVLSGDELKDTIYKDATINKSVIRTLSAKNYIVYLKLERDMPQHEDRAEKLNIGLYDLFDPSVKNNLQSFINAIREAAQKGNEC